MRPSSSASLPQDWLASATQEEARWLALLDPRRIPQHVAIIMDGNGRWARQRGLPRYVGHSAGAESVRNAIEAARQVGVRFLTLYTFSAENWRRPAEEVSALMELIEHKIREEIHALHENAVRVKVLGRLEELPQSLQEELQRDMELTACNTGLTLYLALNYGGRREIADAARRLGADLLAGRLRLEEVDETRFARYLYAPEAPDPELLIRTGGEMRLSNFLLWQAAYTELWITPTLWPDFTKADFYHAIYDFQQRKRRFGGLHEQ